MPLVVPGINSKDTSALDANTVNPVIPSEETIKAGVFDTKRKDEEGERKPEAEHFQATPGPVIPQDTSALGEKAGREELHARAQELNK
ncbi:unnamed protein product [Tuber melanosporum]|jgi:hypothetical protein|uniref:(Perigord truffle) hypothetical protein n=1 Tax=Tuber melanosporum (strain Mel28) TaxID=656061 RepID=D5GQ66_TUBMM|nr:uncharacterized protein GSTUM_00012218001 [Tuber melanosporum]CAZ86659.1 unnamed protein product [Tuber melanosporum]